MHMFIILAVWYSFSFLISSHLFLNTYTNYLSIGYIRCRFREGSSNLKGLGCFLRDCIGGKSFAPSFFLQENYGTPEEKFHVVPILPLNINNMCELGIF